MTQWYKLKGKDYVPATEDDFEEIFDEDTRRVARTEIPNGGLVSTVFLGLDHNWGEGEPLVFETMFFPNELSGFVEDCQRYSTWDEALEGHKNMVLRYGGTVNLLDEDLFQL